MAAVVPYSAGGVTREPASSRVLLTLWEKVGAEGARMRGYGALEGASDPSSVNPRVEPEGSHLLPQGEKG